MPTELIRGYHNLYSRHKGCVATIGNFDGVHLGHQALLKQLVQAAKSRNLPSVVVIFEPQPLEFFAKDKTKIPARLTRLREKFLALSACEVDRVLCLLFNACLAKLSAEKFITDILCEKLGVRHLVVGDDFRFGHTQGGTVDFLQKLGKSYGYSVEVVHNTLLNGERVSSTHIRHALARADHEHAEALLGRPYTMSGRIVHGDKQGRILGFPTANIFLHRYATPVHGIYAVRMHGVKTQPILGVANVGTRPTVGGKRCLLEVFLFDFSEEIYGKHVHVEFCHKLRDEEHFASLELLREQMLQDEKNARAYFIARGELKK